MSKLQETNKVIRILYKEVKDGDRKKVKAESNTTKSGGGARDFRLGSYKKIRMYIEKIFTEKTQVKRKRDGKHVYIDALKGTLYWEDNEGVIKQHDVIFEIPTDARGAEGRIARIHQIECFDTDLIPEDGPGNRVFLLFIQLADGSVWPYYTDEKSLRTPGEWDEDVARELLSCIDAIRPENYAIVGYIDITNGDRYCNGK